VQTVKAPLEVKKDLGPMPKQAKSAYMYFNMEFNLQERKRNPNCSSTEAFKLAGQKWGSMSDEEKAPFAKQAENDKVRYERQLAEREKKGFFILDDKSKSTDPDNAKLFKSKRSASEGKEEAKELKPKRAVSAYIYFATEFGEKTRKSHPELKITQVSVLAGKKWAEMTEAEKKPYIDRNVEDKARQEKEQASIDKRGYFVLEDGSKSTDVKNLPTHRVRKASKSLPSDTEEAVRKPMKKATAKK
jgi:hypothetical protein